MPLFNWQIELSFLQYLQQFFLSLWNRKSSRKDSAKVSCSMLKLTDLWSVMVVNLPVYGKEMVVNLPEYGQKW